MEILRTRGWSNSELLFGWLEASLGVATQPRQMLQMEVKHASACSWKRIQQKRLAIWCHRNVQSLYLFHSISWSQIVILFHQIGRTSAKKKQGWHLAMSARCVGFSWMISCLVCWNHGFEDWTVFMDQPLEGWKETLSWFQFSMGSFSWSHQVTCPFKYRWQLLNFYPMEFNRSIFEMSSSHENHLSKSFIYIRCIRLS